MKIKPISLVSTIVLVALLYGCGTGTRDIPADEKSSFTSASTAAVSTEAEPDELFGFEYDSDNAGICLTAYYGAETVVTVPGTIDGLPVVGIGAECFVVGEVTEVFCPDTLKYFEWGRGCTDTPRKPEKLTVPYGVTKILGVDSPGNTWVTPLSHITEVVIPDTVTEISDWAFMHCYSLASVTIPDSVVKIGQYAFYDCSSLKTLKISQNIAEIPSGAFAGCTSLTSIEIPKGVTDIETSAFGGCYSLDEIAVDPGNAVYASVDGVLFDKAMATLLLAPMALEGSYAIPTGITKIGDYAFNECGRLTNITIPHGVTKIGDGAFRRCYALASIIIPDTVTAIGEGAFSECQSLAAVTLPNTVTQIGNEMFLLCYSLNEVILPPSLTEIGANAFAGCMSLAAIAIPNGVTAIQGGAFFDCSALETIAFGVGVSQIADDAFTGCVSLEYETLEKILAINPNCEFYHY